MATTLDECAKLFTANAQGKYGYSQVCRKCHRISGSTPRARAAQFKHHVRKYYNITIEQYKERMKDACELCGGTVRLCYDHCHETGMFRGTLCRGCNQAIGKLGDNYEGLLKAAKYLKGAEEGEKPRETH